MYILTSEVLPAPDVAVGGKASNLFRLVQAGFRVPRFAVVPQAVLAPEHPATLAEIGKELLTFFPDTPFFAVRSSALVEDGAQLSYAGQFLTCLFVRREELLDKIQLVWHSAFEERVQLYGQGAPLTGLSVIVQEMMEATAAGVAFGVNVATGNRQEKLVSALWGLGEGLVSGALDADTFTIGAQGIETRLAHKPSQVVFDRSAGKGTTLADVPTNKQDLPAISETCLRTLAEWLDRLAVLYSKPQDIEFALVGEELYLLQTRPITGLATLTNRQDVYTLWDNSNIIESYPHVTTPLTFSFISKSYETAYKLFGKYLGVSEKVIHQHAHVFSNTLGFINGRVYYNLKTWYNMLAMLPSYQLNAQYMEKMMGVKERFDVPKSFFVSKGEARWRIIKTVSLMIVRFWNLPKKRRQFVELVNKTIETYKTIEYHKKNAHELMQLYLDFERILLNEWKAPLLNDFFAMIYFGRLQKLCEKYKVSKNPNIHNDLLCGSSDIISTQPIHRTVEIATFIAERPELKNTFLREDAQSVWQRLDLPTVADDWRILQDLIRRYIADFGERCMGELKLETISYRQAPELFINVLKAYITQDITAKSTSSNVEKDIRMQAMREVQANLGNNFWRRWTFFNTLRRARDLVSARENLRYERTRAFGVVREIFTQIGKNFYANDIINEARDIFFLSKEEIFAFIEGKAITQDIKSLIDLRKKEHELFKTLPAPAERFATYGAIYHANDFFNQQKVESIEGDLKGIGCCPGLIRARVCIVHNPSEIASLQGKILVTHSTDPGWVVLFPSASAILVERGSLLSHSAIVAREMGKPCIVGVTGLLKTLRQDSLIEMNGSTGEIKIIEL
jgi:pyruvate,water dikinase